MKYKRIKKYKFTLLESISLYVTLPDADIDNIATIKDNVLVVRSGYSWDGNTCAINTRSNLFPSLVHDVLYQFIREGKLDRGYRQNADIIFRNMLRSNGFKLWWVYYLAVRLFGGLFVDADLPKDLKWQ